MRHAERLEPHPGPARGRTWQASAARLGLAGVATTVLVLLAVAHRGALSAALGTLRAPNPPAVVAAVVAQLASIGLYGRMQRRLLRGAGTTVPLRRAVGLAYAAHSLSITLPGGPLISTVYNYRRMRAFGADSTVAAWCTAASGVLSSVGLVGLTVATGLAAAAEGDDDGPGMVGVLGVVLLAALVPLSRSERVRRVSLAVGRRVRLRLPPGLRRRSDSGVAWAGQLLRVRIPARDLGVATTQSLLNWVTDAACLALCCVALGVHVRPVPLVVTYIAGMTVSGLPIIPGGLGTVDATLVFGLVRAGATASPALAVVVLYRLISFALLGAIGWLLWLLGRDQPVPSDEPDDRPAAQAGAGG